MSYPINGPAKKDHPRSPIQKAAAKRLEDNSGNKSTGDIKPVRTPRSKLKFMGTTGDDPSSQVRGESYNKGVIRNGNGTQVAYSNGEDGLITPMKSTGDTAEPISIRNQPFHPLRPHPVPRKSPRGVK